jgi:hypothetical protein
LPGRSRRPQFGKGPLAAAPAKSVFLNCPYDAGFRERFDALVFSVVCCGFLPRSALETGSVAEPRMARITRALFESKYSIHDLTRCTGEGDANLARFNMPLELGIAMARRYLEKRKARRHDWLVLVPAGHPYRTFISDLAGFDPTIYDGSVRGIVAAALGWLVTREDAGHTPEPPRVLEAFGQFQEAVERLRQSWGPTPPWADLVLAAQEVGRRLRRVRTLPR